MKKIGIFWFSNDLRLHDNPALMRACSQVDELICLYAIDPRWFAPGHSHSRMGPHRSVFLQESLKDLGSGLAALGQNLIVQRADPATCLSSWIKSTGAQHIFRSRNAGWYENQVWLDVSAEFPNCDFHSIDSHTLFTRDQLPFDIATMPATFSQFRRAIESISYAKPIADIRFLPPPPDGRSVEIALLPDSSIDSPFQGGERNGLKHLHSYFSGDNPAHYKQVRNALQGWNNSCKLSPWLANGTLSVREVAARLQKYEQEVVANESTYWIYFELLWREFFQWYAHKNETKLFSFKGLKQQQPLTSFYPERYQKWVNGNTPYPLVNACMRELRETGYLSNRGRQIVASSLVNELATDWRHGAGYFEYALIDYDVASNWGNWQYIAGVGADTREKRHFNLQKQTQLFDPERRYINRWTDGPATPVLDSVDAADWPVA